MTAFAGPRISTRSTAVRASRVTTFAALRESLDGFRGALRSATDTRGDYADALLLGRN
jgi:hypothetical protein